MRERARDDVRGERAGAVRAVRVTVADARGERAAKRGDDARSVGAHANAVALPTSLVKEATDGKLELASDERVLVLDVGYQTIDIVPWQRAMVLQMMMRPNVMWHMNLTYPHLNFVRGHIP